MSDIEANRKIRIWTLKQQIGRVLWAIASPAFFLSPRPLWAWRNVLLRIFGAKIGSNVRIHPTVRITIPWHIEIEDFVGIGDRVHLYALGLIKIADRSTISQNAHICAGSHDYKQSSLPLTKPPITIGQGVWICADAFVGPDVKIGDMAIVGARSVVTKDVNRGMIVAGNPAREIRENPAVHRNLS